MSGLVDRFYFSGNVQIHNFVISTLMDLELGTCVHCENKNMCYDSLLWKPCYYGNRDLHQFLCSRHINLGLDIFVPWDYRNTCYGNCVTMATEINCNKCINLMAY